MVVSFRSKQLYIAHRWNHCNKSSIYFISVVLRFSNTTDDKMLSSDMNSHFFYVLEQVWWTDENHEHRETPQDHPHYPKSDGCVTGFQCECCIDFESVHVCVVCSVCVFVCSYNKLTFEWSLTVLNTFTSVLGQCQWTDEWCDQCSLHASVQRCHPTVCGLQWRHHQPLG